MSLINRLKTAEPAQSGLPCGVARIMSTMSKPDVEALEEVLFEYTLDGKRISNTKIYQILTEEGYSIAPSSIAQHRRHQCRCFVGAGVKSKDKK